MKDKNYIGVTDPKLEQLKNYEDSVLIEEVALRLQYQFRSENGREFRYGSFRFIFHDGRFQGVEDWPRNKRYKSISCKGEREA